MGGSDAGAGPLRSGARPCLTRLTGQGPALAPRMPPPTSAGIYAAPKEHTASDPGKAKASGLPVPEHRWMGQEMRARRLPYAVLCLVTVATLLSNQEASPNPGLERVLWGTHQDKQPHREVRAEEVWVPHTAP